MSAIPPLTLEVTVQQINLTVEVAPATGGLLSFNLVQQIGGMSDDGRSAGVSSFKGRTGAVTPQTGDYTAAQVGADPAGSAAAAQASANSYTDALGASVTVALVGKAPASHTHTLSNVTGLQGALDGKAPTSHTHAAGDISGLGAFATGADAANLTGTLNAARIADGSLPQAKVSGLVTALANAEASSISLLGTTEIKSNRRYVYLGGDVAGVPEVVNVSVLNLSGTALTLEGFGTSPDTLVIQAGAGAVFALDDVDGSGVFYSTPFLLPANFDNTGLTQYVQPASTLQGLAAAMEEALDGKQPLASVLTNTTASFTTAQETKLAGIAAGATVGAAWATNLSGIPSVVAAMTSQAAAAQAIGANAIAAELIAGLDGPPRIGGLALEEPPPTGTGFSFSVWNHVDQFFTWYDSTAINELIGAQPTLVSGTNIKTINGASVLGAGDLTVTGGALTTVTITGTATTAVVANRVYRHTGASAYTSTLTTSGLTAGDILYVQIANSATALITISCAAAIRGATTKVMRNGEALQLYWTGTTFDILGEVFVPFEGVIAPSSNATIAHFTGTKVLINTVIGDNPGYGMFDTANQRVVFPRPGVYQLIAAVRFAGLTANASRAIQAYTYDGVTFFNQEEGSLLTGSEGFIGTTSTVTVTAAGKILELTALQNSGANATIKSNGTVENTRLSVRQLR